MYIGWLSSKRLTSKKKLHAERLDPHAQNAGEQWPDSDNQDQRRTNEPARKVKCLDYQGDKRNAARDGKRTKSASTRFQARRQAPWLRLGRT